MNLFINDQELETWETPTKDNNLKQSTLQKGKGSSIIYVFDSGELDVTY